MLDDADLSGAVLDRVVGRNASIKRARLIGASLREKIFEQTEFTDSDLSDADFSGSTLEKSIFLRTLLARTKFDNANLKSAVFYHSEMVETILSGTDFTGAYFGTMTINDVVLAPAIGIGTTHHRAPSFVSLGTLRKPLTLEVHEFLRKAGVNRVELAFGNIWNPGLQDHEIIDIAYDVARVRTISAIVLNPLFISYAHADRAFVDHLVIELERNGIQCWRDVKNMTVGPVDTQIDRAIRLNPTVLLVLSSASVRSDWVEWEAATARKLERESGRLVLCPIALDDAWKDCPWSGPLRQQIESYHLLDFSGWRDPAIFPNQFSKLREGLRLYYNEPVR